ncbi:hypothetical protein NFI96_012546 [Prochilodus magdalenae]|nr:hypothetical protein NFI96_012546 [Prochilodus magdalenae]
MSSMGYPVSASTFDRRLHHAGLHARRPLRRLSLTPLPDSAKPGPAPLPPANPSATNPSVPSASSSSGGGGGNGKRAPSSTPQQQPAALRYPPREVPPRFRQHEHKQLLKRGQPLPAGSIAVVQPSAASPATQPFSSQTQPA